ncbi:MAG: hypothetical protein AAF936_07435 [Pseudomonadota bacterium]
MTFVRSLTLQQLGTGAGFAIWGFRAIAIGHSDCPALLRGYERMFGEDYPPALGALHLLARSIGCRGGRRVSLAAPGCCGVTADELSLIAMLSAAQKHNPDRRDAHLRWLTGGRIETAAQSAADAIGEIFWKADVSIKAPSVELWSSEQQTPHRYHHAPGNA